MDALGRGLAIMLSMAGFVFFTVFYKTAPAMVQRNETVRSICRAYVQEIMKEKAVSQADWKLFQEELSRIGTYHAELSVYEQRSYKGEMNDVFLFAKQGDVKEDMTLLPGSYVRLVVTEEKKTKAEIFFYGAECVIYAGGHIT